MRLFLSSLINSYVFSVWPVPGLFRTCSSLLGTVDVVVVGRLLALFWFMTVFAILLIRQDANQDDARITSKVIDSCFPEPL